MKKNYLTVHFLFGLLSVMSMDNKPTITMKRGE